MIAVKRVRHIARAYYLTFAQPCVKSRKVNATYTRKTAAFGDEFAAVSVIELGAHSARRTRAHIVRTASAETKYKFSTPCVKRRLYKRTDTVSRRVHNIKPVRLQTHGLCGLNNRSLAENAYFHIVSDTAERVCSLDGHNLRSFSERRRKRVNAALSAVGDGQTHNFRIGTQFFYLCRNNAADLGRGHGSFE